MSAIEQLDAIDRYLNKNWLDEDYPAGEIYNELSENATLKAQIAELESLRKENAALLVALVAKDATLEKIACVGNGNSHGNSIGNCMAIEALAILPSTELLEARDRKRDAKLIGLLSDGSAMSPTSRSWMLRQAVDRESGEWVPELGD